MFYFNLIWVRDYLFRVIAPGIRELPFDFQTLTFCLFSKSYHHRCSVKGDVLGGFTGFAGRRWCCGLFLIKLRDWGLGVSRCCCSVICKLFESTYFEEHLPATACFSKFWHITYLTYLTYYIDVSFYIQFLF